jgi:hypothetical protein
MIVKKLDKNTDAKILKKQDKRHHNWAKRRNDADTMIPRRWTKDIDAGMRGELKPNS